MKYFTPRWAGLDSVEEEMSEDDQNDVVAAYRADLDARSPRLPATIRTLAYGINLHDGLIRFVRVDRRQGTLCIGLLCGDLQVGYVDLDLLYQDVAWSESNLDELPTIARDPKSEALYDEIDAGGNGLWVHRILFWPLREVGICFARLAIRLEPRDDRDLVRAENAYEEIHLADDASGDITRGDSAPGGSTEL